jgi:hypothetical protein
MKGDMQHKRVGIAGRTTYLVSSALCPLGGRQRRRGAVGDVEKR